MRSHWNRLIVAIPMSTHNILLSIQKRKSHDINAWSYGIFRTETGVQSSRGNRAISVEPLKLYCNMFDTGMKTQFLFYLMYSSGGLNWLPLLQNT